MEDLLPPANVMTGITGGMPFYATSWEHFEILYIDTNSLDVAPTALIELHHLFLDVPEVLN